MTDKEQIIIDNYFNIIKDDMGRAIGIQEISDPRELIKAIREQNEQLARKTQECKKLKEQLQANQPTGICETCMAKAILQNDKYRKALEEIEKYCNNQNLKFDTTACEILDIINKAKGE